jgi:virginiamycin B lyase
MFSEVELQEEKPKSWLRRLVLVLVPVAVLGIAAGALLFKARGWEARLDPPQGFVQGLRLEAPALTAPKFPAAASDADFAVEGTVYKGNGAIADFTIVTLEAPGMRQSVYAPKGTYRFEKLPAGTYALTAQTPSREGSQSAELGKPEPKGRKKPAAVVSADILLDKRNPEPYPAAYYAARVQMATPELMSDFTMQCSGCHQVGAPRTRGLREIKDWYAVIERMSAMGAQLEHKTARMLPDVLQTALDGVPPAGAPLPPVPEAAMAGTRIREWRLGARDAFLQDIAIGPDGTIWTVDMNNDTILALDPQSGAERRWHLPDRGHRKGGFLSNATRPFGSPLARQAPRSIVYGEDGRLWITCSLGNEIVAFDPETARTAHWSLPRGGLFPNLIRVHGRDVWFTVALSNQLGHIDLRTDEIRLVDLPAGNWQQSLARQSMTALLGLAAGDAEADAQVRYNLARFTGGGSSHLPLPEGIDVHPDGSVWYTKLYGDRLGRYEPATGEIREWPTPFSGPRRLQIDAEGQVWIPQFGNSGIARFDPQTEAFEAFPLPLPSPLSDRPYSVAIADGKIWVSSTAMDVLYRFSPQSKTFQIFPLSTRTTYMRNLAFSPTGEVCAAYSNLPEMQPNDSSVRVMCLSPSI